MPGGEREDAERLTAFFDGPAEAGRLDARVGAGLAFRGVTWEEVSKPFTR
jgi:hypothetical protein